MSKAARWRSLVVFLLLFGSLPGLARAEGAKAVYLIQVDGLACPFCAYGIEKQLGAVEGVESIETDIRSGTLTVTMRDGTALDEAAARKAVEAAGFAMRGFTQKAAGE